MTAFPALFQPGRIGALTLPNRLIMAAMETNLAGPGGTVSDRMRAYYAQRGSGGVGMVTVEYTCVDSPRGMGGAPQAALDDDAQIESHAALARAIRAGGARACVQLFHAGRQTLRQYTGGVMPVAASAVACKVYREAPEALDAAGIERLIEQFAAAARRAVRAGYDAIEIHGAHGYLLGGFLSGAANRRDDAYGGSLENRMRFPLAVISAVKAAAGSLPVIFRFSADEHVPGGTVLHEALRMAPRFEQAGADALHVSTGTAEAMDWNVDPVSRPQGARLPLARAVRKVVEVPVIAVGVIREPRVAEAAITGGDADFVALGRALLADPDWPAKAREGRLADIRPCTSCNWCVDRLLAKKSLSCAENPLVGHEAQPMLACDGGGRTVTVVGGGPAGIAAALLLDATDWRVTLYERDATLGTGLRASAEPPGKEKFLWYRDYLLHRLERSGVLVRTSYAPKAEELTAANDIVLLAIGGQDRRPEASGLEDPRVGYAYDVLTGRLALRPGQILVYGGGETGCEIADYAAEQGCEVLLVARGAARLARRAQYVYRRHLLGRLHDNPHVKILEGWSLEAVTPAGATFTDADGRRATHTFDQLLLAAGRFPGGPLMEELQALGLEVHSIGDCRDVRRIGDAVHDAYAVVQAMNAAASPGTPQLEALPV
ncbi:FAD-dependent oxidoreductase [Antarcticimicrobium sediminis]|uniref:NADH:flavin oxidoreductase n=1 Tax=Antarcticimicrobium sediminis TaxID=2546227 RepID=A0A4R5EM59_9RHOB|nr:FAD-dependent oxidoreductase [Antarcticimicrobium sediminis]TDE35658.1 NADH:flavin oxidoreductase [Antarcticimicrobium sediminis]